MTICRGAKPFELNVWPEVVEVSPLAPLPQTGAVMFIDRHATIQVEDVVLANSTARVREEAHPGPRFGC